MSAVMELRQVWKEYQVGEQRVAALSGVSLSVEEGEFVAVVGRSGSGKSTLMHILGCLDLPDRGEYLLEGRRVDRYSPEELARVRGRTIGFVFQGFHLLPGLTAVENVALPLLYQKVPAARRRALAEEALEQVELGHRLEHRPGQLSGGQQQRVAIARAMVTKPKILLADEPTGNLDPQCSGETLELLRDFHRSGGTVVLITHDMGVAEAAERRVVIS